MGFLSCCKDCSCWCIFIISTVILLVATGLALSDIAAMTQTQEVIDIILNSPVPQLKCLEVCRTWFSEESGQQCCDRYNSNLCLGKATCKTDYISSSKVQTQILMNDAQSQIITAGLCLISMIVIALFQYNQHKLQNKLQKRMEDKIQTAIDKALSTKKYVEAQSQGNLLNDVIACDPKDTMEIYLSTFLSENNLNLESKQKNSTETVELQQNLEDNISP